jgi:hypothetical protein
MSGGWQPPKKGQIVAESAIPLKPKMPDFERPGSDRAAPLFGALLFVAAAFFAVAKFGPVLNSDWVWLTAGALVSTGRLCTFTVCSVAAVAVPFVAETLAPPDALIELFAPFAKTAPEAKTPSNAASARREQMTILRFLLFID